MKKNNFIRRKIRIGSVALICLSSIQIGTVWADENSELSQQIQLAEERQIINDAALKQAQSFINQSPYSRDGLISAVEKYYAGRVENAEVVIAVDSLKIDWNHQAYRHVKESVESQPYSKKAIIESLERKEFTVDQIQYALNQTDIDWTKEAERRVQILLEEDSLSREEVLERLQWSHTSAGNFTEEEAILALESLDISWNEMAKARVKGLLGLKDNIYSKLGFVKFLKERGFTTEEADYAVNQEGIDWSHQAMLKAKETLSDRRFSKASVIEILTRDKLFTEEEAIKGVNQLDIDWNESAKNDLHLLIDQEKYNDYSQNQFKKLLNQKKYTEEEAEYALENSNEDWNKRALKKANNLLDEISDYSTKDLKIALKHSGFTTENIDFAINNIKVEEINQNKKIIEVIEKLLKNQPYSSKSLLEKIEADYDFDSSLVNEELDKMNIDWDKEAVRRINLTPESEYETRKDLVNILEKEKFAQGTIDRAIRSEDLKVDWGKKALAYAQHMMDNDPKSRREIKFQMSFTGGAYFTTEEINKTIPLVKGDWFSVIEKDIQYYLMDENDYNFKNTLINTLREVDEYTTEEIEHGMNSIDTATWKNESYKIAKYWLRTYPSSKKDLIEVLKEGGYTHEEAEYGAEKGWKENIKLASKWSKEGSDWFYPTDNSFESTWNYIGNNWYLIDSNSKMETGWIVDKGFSSIGQRLLTPIDYPSKDMDSLSGKPLYYLNNSGAMQTGWTKVDNTWYYMDESGVMQTDWQKINGSWYYLDSSGAMNSKTGWNKIGNNWYYQTPSDAMDTGWRKVGSNWYYMKDNAIMQTGWQKINGSWYYLDNSGAMNSKSGWNKIGKNWYYQLPSGAMDTGWRKIGSNWYYMKDNAIMQTGWTKVGSSWYYMNSSGAMQTGWTKVGSTWYYMTGSGAMQTGLQKINNNWYYMDETGAMQTGITHVGDKVYYFYADGSMLLNLGWNKIDGKWYHQNLDAVLETGWNKVGNAWYYMDENGAMQTGWQEIGDSWYYLSNSGAMNSKSGWNKIGNNWYYQNSSGAMATGWRKVGSNWYYMKDNAIMQTGWQKIGSSWYYLANSGAMQTGQVTINGIIYSFNSSGSWEEDSSQDKDLDMVEI